MVTTLGTQTHTQTHPHLPKKLNSRKHKHTILPLPLQLPLPLLSISGPRNPFSATDPSNDCTEGHPTLPSILWVKATVPVAEESPTGWQPAMHCIIWNTFANSVPLAPKSSLLDKDGQNADFKISAESFLFCQIALLVASLEIEWMQTAGWDKPLLSSKPELALSETHALLPTNMRLCGPLHGPPSTC